MKLGRHLHVLAAALLLSGSAQSETVGTLALDGLSFVSFEGIENLAIPAGSTVRFRFSDTIENGVATFSIQPSDLTIAPIPLPGGGGELVYSLADETNGTLRQGSEGFIVSFSAAINATLVNASTSGTRSHTLTFTTEHAQATGTQSQQTVAVDGMQVVPGPRYVQLVGAVPNPENAHPHPGRAVYTVLSGSFDWLPSLQ